MDAPAVGTLVEAIRNNLTHLDDKTTGLERARRLHGAASSTLAGGSN